MEEDDFIWRGGGTKEIADRPHGHGEGELGCRSGMCPLPREAQKQKLFASNTY